MKKLNANAVVAIRRNLFRFFFVTFFKKHTLQNFSDTRKPFENNVMVLNKENQGIMII